MSHATQSRHVLDPHSQAWISQYSPRTQETYRSFHAQWVCHLAAAGKTLLGAERVDVLTFIAALGDAGRKAGTINGAVSTLASLYRFLVDEEVLERSPVVRIKRVPAAASPERPWPSRVEVQRMLDLAQLDGPAEHLLMCLLALNGLRVSEALQIRRTALRVDHGHLVFAFVGKGAKHAIAPLPPNTVAALDRLVAGSQPGADEFLIPWTRYQAKRYVAGLARRAGVDDRQLTPHGFRHAFITHGIEAGIPIHQVQRAARHSKIETTMGYLRGQDNLDTHAAYQVAQLLTA